MSAPPSNDAGKESCEGLCNSCADKGSCEDPRALQNETEDRMTRIKHKIVIGSGKGGVGKSTVTVNLAAALQNRGFKVGILDADITDPNIPKLLGIEDQKMMAGPEGLEPADAAGTARDEDRLAVEVSHLPRRLSRSTGCSAGP